MAHATYLASSSITTAQQWLVDMVKPPLGLLTEIIIVADGI